jgi:thiamine pyrophosphate-dependent acetolactate synthase large subunit-like protein
MASDAAKEFWIECISNAAEECSLTLSPEQLDSMANYVQVSHENYGQAFYSPPASDRLSEIQREHSAAIHAMKNDADRAERNAKDAIRKLARVHRDDHITIEDGGVFRHGGRTERIV